MKSLLLGFTIIACLTAYAPFIGAEQKVNEYVVGISDVIEVNVINEPGLRTSTIISSDGTITFPYIGSVYVKGMKISEIEKTITDRLSDGFIKYPVVTVSLLKSLSRAFFIYGDVVKTGRFELTEKLTILKAISVAGGLTDTGRYGTVKIRRMKDSPPGYRDIYIKLKRLVEGSKESDVILQPEDIIMVERNKTFLIQGEVASRGRFTLENSMTVSKALLQAGGVSQEGLFGTVIVRRRVDNEYKEFARSRLNDGIIENNEVEDIPLMSDDIVVVERDHTILMQGEIVNPGRFILEKDLTVLKALLKVGGVNPNGMFGAIKVRRKINEDPGGYKDFIESNLYNGVIENHEVEDTILQPDDVVYVEPNRTFFIHGEVVRPGKYTLEKDMTVVRAISVAGGIRPDGLYSKVKVRRTEDNPLEYKDITIDLRNTIEGSAKGDMFLQPHDILIVERNKTYFMYGEILKPGEYTLKANMTVFKAITLAGGFTKWGSPKRVKILRSKEEEPGYETIKVDLDAIIDGDNAADIYLLPGDTVVASEGVL